MVKIVVDSHVYMYVYEVIQSWNPKRGKVLCAHKPYFLMPGHKLYLHVYIATGIM